MAITSITFIENPRFAVDFQRFVEHKEASLSTSPIWKITDVAKSALNFVNVFFVSIGSAAYSTLRYAPTSFRHIVLGFGYGCIPCGFDLPENVPLTILKVSKWILSMGWCFMMTSARNIFQALKGDSEPKGYLLQFSDSSIDFSHIQTHELAIDVSHVPAAVAVNNLLAIYDAINFDTPEAPGYMKPSSRKEAGYNEPYTIENLREGLTTFVDYVNQRKAFLGTPPLYDTPRLMKFYQQIEDAVRFSIHKVTDDLAQFRRENGENVREYSAGNLRKYKNILESNARVAINLAIAGKHCGARFMGESMELYSSLSGENCGPGESLQDSLIKLLGLKRKEIAAQQLQQHLGPDTHAYNRYMSSLGTILALPGTKDIIETLSRELDREHYLKLFFKEYTDEVICDTVQEKIQTSQVFREQVTDWLKDQVEDWRPAGSQEALEFITAQATPILRESVLLDDFSLKQNFSRLQQLVIHLKQSHVTPPDKNQDLNAYLTKLFSSPAALEWCQSNSPTSPLERAKLKQGMKSLFNREELGPALIDKIIETLSEEGGELKLEDFSERLLILQKVHKINEVARGCKDMPINLSRDTRLRIVQGEESFHQALVGHLDRQRKEEFLQQLKLETMQQEGLSLEILEWILVANHILVPKFGRAL